MNTTSSEIDAAKIAKLWRRAGSAKVRQDYFGGYDVTIRSGLFGMFRQTYKLTQGSYEAIRQELRRGAPPSEVPAAKPRPVFGKTTKDQSSDLTSA